MLSWGAPSVIINLSRPIVGWLSPRPLFYRPWTSACFGRPAEGEVGLFLGAVVMKPLLLPLMHANINQKEVA
jgi:hypothetical protein